MPHPIGKKLRQYRGTMTQREAAKKLGCNFTYLSKIEHGRFFPSWAFLKRMCDLYHVEEDDKNELAYLYLTKNHKEEFTKAVRFSR